ncbi:MAG: hypothetical protein GWP03_01045 [Proteobacteria bacterium]|nr:hypothetical protein [Pseudomonadota bacterium]
MSDENAVSLITYRNAKILGMEEKDKLANVVVWNINPLHIDACPKLVLGEEKILRKR